MWIAFTGIYGVIVVFVVVFETWPTVARTYHHPAYIYQMSPQAQSALIRNATMQDLEQMLVAADRAGNVPQAKEIAAKILERRAEKIVWDPLEMEMANGYTMTVSSDISHTDKDLLAKEYARVLNAQLPEARLSAIGKALMFWFIPCIVIAAFGLLCRWVYHGFRKPPAAT